MKAAVYRRYGSAGVVKAEEVPTPVPRGGRVQAVLEGILGWYVHSGDPPRPRRSGR